MERVDGVIVGAGVVGLATAARLASPERPVVVLERHPRHGVETSSRNSEVVHAGLYYPKGSLKSRLCHEGRRALYRMAEGGAFFIKKTGKLVVAVDSGEAAGLSAMAAKAADAGAEGLSLLGGAEAMRRAPGLRAEAALWSPETGIVDSEELMGHYKARAEDAGALFLFGTALKAAERSGGSWVLTLDSGEQVAARWVVNSAGLHADKVAALPGLDIDAAGYRLHWCKGDYFRMKRSPALPHLVYPMPVKHGLGTHMTLDREGGVRLGPDTAFVDSLDYAVDPGKAAAFAQSVARYWPGLRAEDILPDQSGIRPKLSGPQDPWRDFVVAEESSRGLPGWVNLVGIESPGLTASPAIADLVASLLHFS
ncbi:MAG: NAD(P)/FAD-dependent oxidoreductase [Elusimicrobia bacterium]|nr:NAD(P)/FAD-dependent oxidoreductase [Elusimicrobiota bacterium]